MRFRFVPLDADPVLSQAVVVVDVLRAFTTAAEVLAAGASEITAVASVAEARALRDADPDLVLLGEVDGLPIPGFDLWNSPVAVDGLDLTGRRCVQRTSAGTQGLVRHCAAPLVLAAAFTTAGATAAALRQAAPEAVTFVVTGASEGRDGEEDRACAELIAALAGGDSPDPEPYLERARKADAGRLFADPHEPIWSVADLERALQVDRWDFALRATRQRGAVVLHRSTPAQP